MPLPAIIDQQPSRNWWSGLAKSPSTHDSYGPEKVEARSRKWSQSSPKSSPFGSLASAIGLKSKKHTHPSLAIQQPPSPLDSISSYPVSPISNNTRPASKAASSTRSRVDSIEPKTPVDFQRDRRHSLLTLSDTDPFAGRPIITVPVPHIPIDPNRLSAYSNSSYTDKKAEPQLYNRVSYGSSSSHSNHHTLDILPNSPISPLSESKRLRSKSSYTNVRTDTFSRQASVTMSSTTSLSGSVPPSQQRPNTTDSGPRKPATRARGMTDGAVRQRAGFFVDTSLGPRSNNSVQKSVSAANSPIFPDPPATSAYTPSPRVIVRQASVSHLHSPPTAPPTHNLPATPSDAPEAPFPHKRVGFVPKAQSASSSRLSFASSISLASDMFGPPLAFPRDVDKRFSGRSILSHQTADIIDPDIFPLPPRDPNSSTPGSPPPLKKVSSHQTLRRGATSPSSPVSPKPSHPPNDKKFRKQRSFHRVPLPPLPLPYFSTSSTAFPSSGDVPTSPEQKRGSTQSSLCRKRLFSNSSHNRPSTSQTVLSSEDDKQSLFSLKSDYDIPSAPYKPWATTTNHSLVSSSFWDESTTDVTPGSPTCSTIDYTPQAILSPAELAKLEASVEERSTRSRGLSIMSASTVFSDLDLESECNPMALAPAPAPSSQPSTANQGSSRSSQSGDLYQSRNPHPESLISLDTSSPRLSANHNKEQPTSPPGQSSTAGVPNVSPRILTPSFGTSLPPPPRHRQRSALASPSEKPPPNQITSRAPSVRRTHSTRTKPITDRSILRRSIMRKPSFLEIDDDTDPESDSNIIPERTSSFLDMARESFETARDGF